MTDNKMRQLIQSGKLGRGIFVFIPSEAVIDVIGWAGFDFVILDTEHASYDLRWIERMARAAEARNMATLCRISNPDPYLIQRVLDTGVDGVVFARVSTKKEAEGLVESCNLAPMGGTRGAGVGMRAGQYHLMSAGEYNRRSADVVKMVMIETKEGMDNAKDIASVHGIDLMHVGIMDLAWDLDCAMEGREIDEALKKINQITHTTNVRQMITVANPEEMGKWLKRDSSQRLFWCFTDMFFLSNALKGFIQESNEVAAKLITK